MKAAIPAAPYEVSHHPKQEEEEEDQVELRRGPWTLEEDNLLIHSVACHGEGRWNSLAKASGLKRTGKSCRLRWLNYLKPDIKRGNLTPQEQLLILELHSKWGWSKIAQHLPGRTDNEIKNYWRTRVQKQARQLNMESNSPRFIDAIRCFYMPRLVQKIEQNSSSSTTMNLEGASDVSLPPQYTTVVQHTGGNSSSSNNSPSSMCSMLPEISSYQTSPSPVFDQTVYTNTKGNTSLLNGDYYMDSTDYDVDQLASVSAAGPSDLLPDCHVVDHKWMAYDMADDVWNLDELWQFRK
ncbi:hypothetical protein Ancab_021080 [Ancistrocladus abbreviatus]